MNNNINIRDIEKKDIKEVLEIYNFHIINGLANFEEEPISYENFNIFYQKILELKLPFIVCEKNDKIIGFTYLNKFREKSGYRYSFEDSIYIDNNFIGLGIGNMLLKELINASLNNKNIKTIIAVIGNYNSQPSIRIHKKNGFKIVGTMNKIGFKNNQWLDSIYMQKILNE